MSSIGNRGWWDPGGEILQGTMEEGRFELSFKIHSLDRLIKFTALFVRTEQKADLKDDPKNVTHSLKASSVC